MIKVKKIKARIKEKGDYILFINALCMLALVIGGVFYLGFLLDYGFTKKATRIYKESNSVEAKVAGYHEKKDKYGQYFYYPIFKYSFDGKVYEEKGMDFEGHHFLPGAEMTIYVDKSNPDEFMVPDERFYKSDKEFIFYTTVMLSLTIMPISTQILSMYRERKNLKLKKDKKKR